MANGVNYNILESIPLGRYIRFQKESVKLTYGTTFPEMFKNMGKAYQCLNDRKHADAAVIIHNMMSEIKGIEEEKRVEPALMICALFIVRDDEDLSKVDDEYMQSKIDDWAKEGYEVNGFFHLALTSIEGFRETFLEYIQKN